jgi:TetR/AcrR family transcriptional regulator
MLKDGYAAVTSRRIAAEAGLNPALVHYYFHTMDDLFLALFRRRAERGMVLQADALASEQPLWALWDLNRNHEGTALTMEFVALANHRKAIRAEIGAASERHRAAQVAALRAAFERHDMSPENLTPLVGAVMLSSLSTLLAAEVSLEISTGHAETIAFVEQLIARLEGERRA